MAQTKVIVIDYGSQVTQLIARRIREAGVYSEIHPCNTDIDTIINLKPAAIVLSGGPASVNEPDSPKLNPKLFELKVPVLGICYGMQLIAKHFDGELVSSITREYGPAKLSTTNKSLLWKGVDEQSQIWMSHGDKVIKEPPNFTIIAKTETLNIAAIANVNEKIYAVQFHPEVHHSTFGSQIIKNFLFEIANIVPDWTMQSFIDNAIDILRKQIGDKHVVCAISGGIDSTVVGVLLNKAIGNQLHCIFVDNGLLREGEAEAVVNMLTKNFKLNLKHVDASQKFLHKLKGVDDPEKKRKIIGHTFIEIFDEESKKIPDVVYLAQGTLYPDVIESISSKGPSAVIKSHHNVGGLPKTMNLNLVEPLRELFKDEVREVAKNLGLPDNVVFRHPFPGPGLAIRILGDITEEKLSILRKADKIVIEELRSSGWYNKIWQGFAVLLPLRTVGVMGDDRTYENVIALRMVDSVDAMTADWSRLPYDIIAKISSRIINEVKGVNRVVYDVSSKPPSTIEWE